MSDCRGTAARERVQCRFSPDDLQQMARRAAVVEAYPESASDSEKLRILADYLDVTDAEHGRVGSEVQDFLRDLARRLDGQEGR